MGTNLERNIKGHYVASIQSGRTGAFEKNAIDEYEEYCWEELLKWRAREGGWTLGRPALAPSGADAVLIAPGNQPNLSEVLVHPERNSGFG